MHKIGAADTLGVGRAQEAPSITEDLQAADGW